MNSVEYTIKHISSNNDYLTRVGMQAPTIPRYTIRLLDVDQDIHYRVFHFNREGALLIFEIDFIINFGDSSRIGLFDILFNICELEYLEFPYTQTIKDHIDFYLL